MMNFAYRPLVLLPFLSVTLAAGFGVRSNNNKNKENGGVNKLTQEERDLIINGHYAYPGNHPYTLRGAGRCGGTYIGDDFFLSAAQCVNDLMDQSGDVDVGDNDHFEYMTVRRMYIHPLSNFNQNDNYDFMIGQFWWEPGSRPDAAASTPDLHKVQPVTLNYDYTPTEGDEVTIIGYGMTVPGFRQSEISDLREATLTIETTATCQAEWAHFDEPYYESSMMCADGNNTGPCLGDTGMPLLRNGEMVGITSMTRVNDCSENYRPPNVFSRLSAAQDWIEREMCWLGTPTGLDCANLIGDSFRIVFGYDSWPEETSWRLIEVGSSDPPIADHDHSTVIMNDSRMSEHVSITFGATYELQVEDTWGDGAWGASFHLYYVDSNLEQHLIFNVTNLGLFGLDETWEFVAGYPDAPTEICPHVDYSCKTNSNQDHMRLICDRSDASNPTQECVDVADIPSFASYDCGCCNGNSVNPTCNNNNENQCCQ